MKVFPKNSVNQTTSYSTVVVTGLVLGTLGILALAVFLIKKCRSSSTQKHEYSALKTDSGNEKYKKENEIRNGAFLACKQYLCNNERYEFRTQLCEIGSRADKHWFTVQDTALGAQRLLTLVPLPPTCPILPSHSTKCTLVELFRGLQHPYIHPVLDIEFWETGAALITPLNLDGSLRDLIYGAVWHEDYSQKYPRRGQGLPMKTVQCLGRQILEGLLFLRNRHFPPFRHLHSGNIIIQNGVARIAGLENTLLGILPRPQTPSETLAFGSLLFEMASGYEMTAIPGHSELALERLPKLSETLDCILKSPRPPSFEDIICSDFFRGVELRELRGASITQVRQSNDVLELLDVVRNPIPPSPIRRKDVVVVIEERRLEDIQEEDNEDSDSASGIVDQAIR